GTSPNVIYEKEHPNTFKLDKYGQFFQSYAAFPGVITSREACPKRSEWDGEGSRHSDETRPVERDSSPSAGLGMTQGSELIEVDPNTETGFFTSYQRGAKRITFYGDNHPKYAGNVVKAMASAKDGYPHIVSLFDGLLGAADDSKWLDLVRRLDDGLVARVH